MFGPENIVTLMHIHEIMEPIYWLVTQTTIPNKIAYQTYKPCDSFPLSILGASNVIIPSKKDP